MDSPRGCRLRLEAADHASSYVPTPDHGIARVIKVYDGDTITVLAEVAGALAKLSLRAEGVDTPELRGCTPIETRAGTAVRDAVASRCMGKIVKVAVSGSDKYGRLLSKVCIEDEWEWCQYLMQNGLAHQYAGRTKKPFCQSELEEIEARAMALVRKPAEL